MYLTMVATRMDDATKQLITETMATVVQSTVEMAVQ